MLKFSTIYEREKLRVRKSDCSISILNAKICENQSLVEIPFARETKRGKLKCKFVCLMRREREKNFSFDIKDEIVFV